MDKNEAINTLKGIVSKILYLESGDEFSEDESLFIGLNMSSIDYVDLCFEVQEKVCELVTLENLWPINGMLLDPALYEEPQWTPAGWREVCKVLGWTEVRAPMELTELYEHFTISYICRRVEFLSAKEFVRAS